jgi:DNA/RNA-binding domain of Phe-tRNA-synthetase-like protein
MDILELTINGIAKCSVGILVMENVNNTSSEDRLKPYRQELEDTVRLQYGHTARAELKAFHPMDAYISYYKKFGNTYHVLPQLESVIQGKPIHSGSPLVEAMFLAELKNMLLTAGHDLHKVKVPMCLKVSTGSESYAALGGHTVSTIANDVMISDQEGVISSILRGPDMRTVITAHTTCVVYTVYAPDGVEEELVRAHLGDIERYVRIVSEESSVCFSGVFDGKCDKGTVLPTRYSADRTVDRIEPCN